MNERTPVSAYRLLSSLSIKQLEIAELAITTGCSTGTDKNYALIAWARKQPIS